MIFEFDASLVLASGDIILYASHDSILYASHDSDLYVACRSAELRDGIAREYAEFWPVRIGGCPAHMR